MLKKSKISKNRIVIFLVLTLLTIAGLWFMEGGITGADISLGLPVVNETLEINNTFNKTITFPEENLSLPSENITANESENTIKINLQGDLGIRANCGGVTACNCGDTVTSDYTLSADLEGCSGNGLVVTANSLTIDCQGYSITGSGTNYGFYNTASNTVIKNCNISGFKGGLWLRPTNLMFYLSGLNITNNTFSNNTGNNNNGGGIVLDNIQNSRFQNNTFTNNFIGFNIGNSDSNIFENNYFLNNTVGYDWQYASDTNNVSLDQILNNTYGVLINSTSATPPHTNTFRDVQFANNTFDVSIIEGVNSNLTFINSTINKSRLYVYVNGKAYFKWYVDVNVTDTSGNALQNVEVKSYDSLNAVDNNQPTDATGIGRLEVTEFYRNDEVNYYLTPGTVKASLNNYTQNSTSLDLIDQTYASINLTLTPIGCGGTVYGDLSLGNDYSCSGAGLIIGTNSITINGNNYNLTGDSSDIGINSTSKDNISIINLKIKNFTRGIDLLNTNNSNFTNLVITNNTYGIVFNNSHNNDVYDSTLENNSVYSVLADNSGETNNSLINISIDLNNVSVHGTAQIFLKWYVNVNANYTDANSNIYVLPNANASGFFNSTQELEHSLLTNSDGVAKLILSELKKNASGITYLTPHNVSISFTSSSGTQSNFTYVNLTQTNNTQVNLSVTLDCTSPYSQMYVNNNTTFCPGSFDVDKITINASGINLNCDTTSLTGGIYIDNQINVQINNCSISDGYLVGMILPTGGAGILYTNLIDVISSTDITIYNGVLDGDDTYSTGIDCLSSQIILNNTNLSVGEGLTFQNCENSTITKNLFEGQNGIDLDSSNHNVFTNNTFNRLNGKAIIFDTAEPSNNNSFYYNTFTSISSYNIEYFNTSASGYSNTFNTSIAAGYGQGNQYSDYCDKGTDLNNDGYADAGTWPYNATTSSKIYDPNGDTGVVDYGPKIISCPATDVFLGGGGGGVVTAPAPAEAPAVAEGETKTIEEPLPLPEKPVTIKEFKVEKPREGVTAVTFVLENTGTEKMSLFPELLQDTEDPFFIVNKKTLGYEGSLFSKISGLAYSRDTITGRLLKAEILNPEQIILEPGERIEKTIEVKEGLVSQQIKIQFTTLSKVVTEKEVSIGKAFTGTAIDVNKEKEVIDVYAIFVPEELTKVFEEYYAGETEGKITGGAVTDTPHPEENKYYLELVINKKRESSEVNTPMKMILGKKAVDLFKGIRTTYFADLYGPYTLKEAQSFVFAQQLKYDKEKYQGDFVMKTKIYRGSEMVVENEFDLNLGERTMPEELPLTGEAAKENIIDKSKKGISFSGDLSSPSFPAETFGNWLIPIIAGLMVLGMISYFTLIKLNTKEVKAKKLMKCIVDMKQEGISETEIKKALLEKGWPKTIVDDYVDNSIKRMKKKLK